MSDASAGVLLVGHGSHLSPESARPVHQLGRRLRAERAFAEVGTAFWKEEPSLRHALDLMESRVVYVVPIFTSEGYFTDVVVPRELGIGRNAPPIPERSVHLCRPVGAHPRMGDVVRERAREAAPLEPERERRAVLVIIGHGTELHPRSAGTTEALAARLRSEGPYPTVRTAFLDQEPRIEKVLATLDAPDVVLVPFFISEGWHTGTTVPRDLALTGGRTRRGSTTLWYARPVGTHPAVAGVVRDLVREATAGSAEGESGAREAPEELPIEAAKRACLDWLREMGSEPRFFLQVAVRKEGVDRFELRHVEDSGVPPMELQSLRDPEDAVALATLTGDGRHRPLRTSPDLRQGWRFTGLGAGAVWEVLGHLYPGAFLHQFLVRTGRLVHTSFADAAQRQTGIHAGVGKLPAAGVAALVRGCCATDRCLRTPTWAGASLEDGAGVPCPEPCSLFISSARKALDERGGSG